MATVSFETDAPAITRKHRDITLCFEIMDELRHCALHCRASAKTAVHVGTRVGLNSVALLCDSGLSALQQCLQLLHPFDHRHLAKKTEQAIDCVGADDEDWRPGPFLLPDT